MQCTNRVTNGVFYGVFVELGNDFAEVLTIEKAQELQHALHTALTNAKLGNWETELPE